MMSESVDQAIPRETSAPVPEAESARDMSRARWQAGEAAVVFTQAADVLFADGSIATPDIKQINKYAKRERAIIGTDPHWFKACDVLLATLDVRADQAMMTIPDTAKDGINHHTYYGAMHNSVGEVVREALKAQICFTLNAAQMISLEAERREIDGFGTDTYSEIAALISRADFGLIIHTSLLTRNGVWGGLSFKKGMEFDNKEDYSPEDPVARNFMRNLIFDEQRAVALGPDFTDLLRANLRHVNQLGNSTRGVMSDRTSSGCPARHLKPHFSNSPADQARLAALATAYGTSPEELLTERKTTVVADGLRFMATILENFDDYCSGAKTTYSSSEQYRASTDQPSAGRA